VIERRQDIWKLFDHFGLVGEIAEVGVAEAYFSEQIATWDAVTKVWMIDNWATIEGQKGDASNPQEWHDSNYIRAASICEHNVKCKMVPGLSTVIAEQFEPESLVMVYLDANHSYEAVKADLNAWFDKVKSGGIISGHDYLSEEYGVKQAVNEFCSGIFEIHIIPEFEPYNASFWFRKL